MRPVDLIWQMWTDPEHFKEWFGPDGATIPVAKMDVRVGGSRLVCMEIQTPAGRMRCGSPANTSRSSTTNSSSTPSPCPTRTARCLAIGDGHERTGIPPTPRSESNSRSLVAVTKMVMTHAGIPSDSPGAAGWTMALDKLAVEVAKHSGR